ncbi:hypothetical protein ABFS82_04G093200 [Erythranthe guttata]
MWPELGNAWTEGRSSSSNTSPMVTASSSFHPSVVHEIHVLLVDHDSESLVSTAKLLEICQYRVTFVELASAAISMLLSGKAKFDVVMANVNSPDLHGFKLLQHAATMGLPVVLMSAEENSLMAMRALENGAFLYIKKPATLDIMRCLWQHVLREKTRLVREREMLASVNKNANNANTIVSTNHGSRGVNHDHQFKEMNNNRGFENPDYYNSSNNNNNMGRVSGHLHHVMMKNNKGKAKKKIRGISRHGLINGLDEDECDSDSFHVMVENSNNNNNSGNVKRKMCTEWTQELHAKFMDAVEQLGEGRCFPKEILELMDVPGLTRMQVASHLQKCRNDNWRSPLERRANQANHDSSPDANGAQPKPRRFGSKPQLGRTRSGPAQESHGTRQGSETHSEAETPHSGGGHVTPNNNDNGSPQEQYGSSVVAGPSNIRPGAHSSSNPRQHSTDEFFNFPEMDCLMQNLSSGLPQAPAAVVDNPSPSPGSYHVDPAYNDQNSAGPSAETRSNWSSETSNFESDHS